MKTLILFVCLLSFVATLSAQVATKEVPLSKTVTMRVTEVLPPEAIQLTYQWFKNNAVVTGQTTTTLVLEAFTAADVGTYYCRIRNPKGEVITNRVGLLLANVAPAGASMETVVSEPTPAPAPTP
jgi:heme A synthase